MEDFVVPLLVLVGILYLALFFVRANQRKAIVARQEPTRATARLATDASNDKNKSGDSEFTEKSKTLDLFLNAQELLISAGGTKPVLSTKQEKLKYLHFVFGATDQLSRTIKDEKRAQAWWSTTSLVRASFELGMDDGMKELEKYGNTDDPELHDAGKRGYFAMQTCLLSATGKCTKEECQKSCTELFAVVRSVE